MIYRYKYMYYSICGLCFVFNFPLLRKVLRATRKKNAIVVFKKINKYCKSLYLVVV